jgi:hypothetical protein
LSSEKLKITYEQLLSDIRADLNSISKLFVILNSKLDNKHPDEDIKKWITDIFLDKIYELEAKMIKIFNDSVKYPPRSTIGCVEKLKERAFELAFDTKHENVKAALVNMKDASNNLIRWTEADLSDMRRTLRKSGWSEMNKIEPVSYISLERRRYVTAREELLKAKENAKKNPEDVMNHARTAIELAIRERFNFRRITKMVEFIEQADKNHFPLPSYDLIYTYFSEGSHRIHQGRIHTTFEANEVIRTVSNFIDELDVIEITKTQIKDFVNKCNCVQL